MKPALLAGKPVRNLAVRLRGREGIFAVVSWSARGVVVRVPWTDGVFLISAGPEEAELVLG